MRPGRGVVAAKVPAVFVALAASSACSSSCWEEASSCRAEDQASAASLIQHRHHRSHAHISGKPDTEAGAFQQVFPDVTDLACNVGTSCVAGGIPPSRGACVAVARGLAGRPNECWDICNLDHLPQDYTTGDSQFEAKLERAVNSVRAGEYPHMRCPASNADSGNSEAPSASEARQARNIIQVMEGIQDAEKAAEKARLLTLAAKRESAALENAGEEGSEEVAEVMKSAAAAEAEAAEKAKAASEDLKLLAESRRTEAAAEEAAVEAKSEEARQKEEEAAADVARQAELEEKARQAEEAAAQAESEVEQATNVTGNGSGCCFSFVTDRRLMEPCCLSAEAVAERSLCVERDGKGEAERDGAGKTGFTSGSCPRTPKEAQVMLQDGSAAPVEDIVIPDIASAETLEELQKKIEAMLEQEMRRAVVTDTLARSKADLAKEKETAAAVASAQAKKAGMEELAQGGVLEAKMAALEAREAELDAGKAVVSVKKNVELKKLIECKVLAEKTSQLKKEVEEFTSAIKQAKAIQTIKGGEHITDTHINSLTAATVDKMQEVEDSKKLETACPAALEDAKNATATAQGAVSNSEAEVEQARLEKEEVQKALQGSQNSAVDGSNSTDDESERTIIQAGSDGGLTRWGRGVSKAVDVQSKDSNGRNCAWEPELKCVAKFRYQGKMYEGCTEVGGEEKAWCSLDSVYVGRWKSCSYVCKVSDDDIKTLPDPIVKDAEDVKEATPAQAEEATPAQAEEEKGDKKDENGEGEAGWIQTEAKKDATKNVALSST